MIECVWVEVRPALRCCHVCVVFKEDITSEVKLKVKKSGLLLEIRGRNHNVEFKNFTLEPLTMSGFKAAGRFLSFRIQTECHVKAQVVPSTKSEPPFVGKEKISLLCRCHNPLTVEVTFERVLPLPTNEFNLTDLFCHFHDKPPENVLTPKPNDCLYSDHFILIREELLTGCAKRGKFLKCKRCRSTTGVYDGTSIKLWTSSLRLPCDTTPVGQFKHFVRKAVSDPFSLFPQLLLECQESLSYLSIVVVDKNLIVSSCGEDLETKNSEVVKVKYKFHASCDAHVKSLVDDVYNKTQHIHVLKFMLDSIIQYLVSACKTIPPLFSKVGNECMVYLNLCD